MMHRLSLSVMLLSMLLGLDARRAGADPDTRDGMPEPLPASGGAAGTLLPVTGERTHFAAVGDFGYPGAAAEAVAAMIRSWEPSFIITTGDNTYGPVEYRDVQPLTPGMQTGWDDYVGRFYGEWILRRTDGRYDSLSGSVQRFFPSVGNHDNTLLSAVYLTQPPPPPIEGYLDYFHDNPGGTPRLPVDRGAVHDSRTSYYAMQQGVVDFFVLDSNQPFLPSQGGPEILGSQGDWLAAEAAASTARWKLAVYHHPPPRPFQIQWPWLAPERLALCDAALTGHDHVYERYLWNGLPVVVTGNGGAPLRRRFQPFYPDTLAVDDRRYGAVKVQAGQDYLEFESRSLDPATGAEQLADRFVLGNAAAVPDGEDEYVFQGVEGEQVEISTASEGPLDPALTLYDPAGRVAARDRNGAADGRNARLRAPLSRTGLWKVKVTAESDRAGAYQLKVRLLSPGPDYAGWLAEQPSYRRGTEEDINGDGDPNLIAYALTPWGEKLRGSALTVSAAPGISVARVPVPQPMRQGVTLSIETATSLNAPAWVSLAERRPLGAWTNLPGTQLSVGPVTQGRQLVQVVVTGGTQRFFRLRVTLAP